MDFVHDSIVAHVVGVSQKKRKGKGKDAEPVLRVFVQLKVTDPAEWNPVLSDLLDMEVQDVVQWWEDNSKRIRSASFAQRFVQRRVNLRHGAEILSSINEAIVDQFRVDFVADALTFRASAVSSGLQIGALSELLGDKIRLEIVSLQGELPLEAPATTKEKNATRKAKEATPA